MFESPLTDGINNEKLKTFSYYLHETVSLFSGVIEEFNILEKRQEHSNISTQSSALKENYSIDTCNHCEELQQIISSKDDMIQSVVSTLTKLIETKDLNIVEDILKILSVDTSNFSTPQDSMDTCTIKTERSPESTPTCSKEQYNKSISVVDNMRNNDSSVSEIEDTPGRKSPIIFLKKLSVPRTFVEPQSVSLKKKSDTNWTSPAKLIKLTSPANSKLSRPNARMRQTRLCITKARAENVVDLTASPDFKQEPDDDQPKCAVKLEPMESEDAILPSPTSDPQHGFSLVSTSNGKDDEEAVNQPCEVTVYKNRVDSFIQWEENEFHKMFRLSKRAVNIILFKIAPMITSNSNRRNTVRPYQKLLLTLRYLATSNIQGAAASVEGMYKTTAEKYMTEVLKALLEFRHQHLRMPTNVQEIAETKIKFSEIAKFPNVIGAVDCTHVRIESTCIRCYTVEDFINKKGYISLKLQAICDAQLKFRNIIARWPGATPDGRIFSKSVIKKRFESGEFGNSLLLADSGYEMTNYCLTPIKEPISLTENLYNAAHIKTSSVTKKAFLLLKRRFPVLTFSMVLTLDMVQQICVTVTILHNIAIDLNESEPPPLPDAMEQAILEANDVPNVIEEYENKPTEVLPKLLKFKSSKNTSYSSKLNLKKHAKSRLGVEYKPAGRLDEEKYTSDDDFRIDSPSKKGVSELQFSSMHGMSLLERVDDIETKALREVNRIFKSELKIPLAENVNAMNIAGNTHNAGRKMKKDKTPSPNDARASNKAEEPKNLIESLVNVKLEQDATTKKDVKKYEPIYKELAPRKKIEKRALPGWSCEECKIFYEEMYKNNPEMLRKLMGECSKHRGRHNPVRARTPPGFWEPRWNVADDTDTFNRQNNAL